MTSYMTKSCLFLKVSTFSCTTVLVALRSRVRLRKASYADLAILNPLSPVSLVVILPLYVDSKKYLR